MEKGFYGKYIIAKSDGSPIDPKAEYLVLRLDTDSNARGAARNYANRIMSVNPLFSQQLRNRVDEISLKLLREGEE